MGKIIWEPYTVEDINWKARSMSEAYSRTGDGTRYLNLKKEKTDRTFTYVLMGIIAVLLVSVTLL